jgi:hypothetical protein
MRNVASVRQNDADPGHRFWDPPIFFLWSINISFMSNTGLKIHDNQKLKFKQFGVGGFECPRRTVPFYRWKVFLLKSLD